jgi:hypothetical protein
MKLFAVEITYSAYVLAENRFDAEDFVDEITDTEIPSVDVTEETSKQRYRLLQWEDGALVYHSLPKDITVKQAREMIEES